MNGRTAALLKAFYELPDNLKSEVVDELNKYYAASESGRRTLNEDVKRVLGSSRIDFGPVGSPCPMCGKS